MTLHVGLTGGIGSGKSTVAQMLVAHGAELIDADVLARDVVRPGAGALAQIVDTFGPGVLTDSGELDRVALGAIVFDDDDARARLNAIVHPAVRAAGSERFRAVRRADPHAIVVEDIPLLVETGAMGRFHLVIVVQTPLELRLERLTQRGMTRAEARARIAAQASDEQRAAAADILLVNDGSIEDLRQQVRHVWEEVVVPYQAALARGGVARGSGPRPDVPRPAVLRPGGMERALRRLHTQLPGAHVTQEAGCITVRVAQHAGDSPAPAGNGPGAALLAAGFLPTNEASTDGVSADLFCSAEPGSSIHVRLLQGCV